MTLLTPEQRETIERNYANLTETIMVMHGLLDHLLSQGVITNRQKARIEVSVVMYGLLDYCLTLT